MNYYGFIVLVLVFCLFFILSLVYFFVVLSKFNNNSVNFIIYSKIMFFILMLIFSFIYNFMDINVFYYSIVIIEIYFFIIMVVMYSF